MAKTLKAAKTAPVEEEREVLAEDDGGNIAPASPDTDTSPRLDQQPAEETEREEEPDLQSEILAPKRRRRSLSVPRSLANPPRLVAPSRLARNKSTDVEDVIRADILRRKSERLQREARIEAELDLEDEVAAAKELLLAAQPASLVVNEVRHILPRVVDMLLPNSSRPKLTMFAHQISHPDFNHDYHDYIHPHMKLIIELKIRAYYALHPEETPYPFDSMEKKEFCRILKLSFSEVALGTEVQLTLAGRLKNVSFKFALANPTLENQTMIDIINIFNEFVTPDGVSSLTPVMQTDAVKVLNDFLPKKPVDWKSIVNAVTATTVMSFIDSFCLALTKGRIAASDAKRYGLDVHYGPDTSLSVTMASAKRSSDSAVTSQPSTKKGRIEMDCTGCGKSGHLAATCHLKTHPDFNPSTKAWKLSTQGVSWLSRGQQLLPTRLTLSGTAFEPPPHPSSLSDKNSGSSSSSSTTASSAKGMITTSSMVVQNDIAFTLSSLHHHTSSNLLSCTLFVSSQEQNSLQAREGHKVNALLDTGSLAGDFISQQLVDRLSVSSDIISSSVKSVCSGLNNNCIDLSKTINVSVLFLNEITNKINSFSINAFILQNSPLDLIVGITTIKRLNLFSALPSLISSLAFIPEDKEERTHCTACTIKIQPALVSETHVRTSLPLSASPDLHASLVDSADHIFGNQQKDNNEIPDKVGAFEPWLPIKASTDDILSKINISGSDSLRAKIKALCEEFRDLFCEVLPSTPAKLKPFDIVVNEEQWQVPNNRTPPRRLSPQKQQEVQKQVSVLLKQGILEPSSATYYSQALLVAKPGLDTYRLCVDYRNLNNCTKDASWPIPNIDQMFRRIGTKKPKFFGSMDLTQGYHQAPISLSTRIYTAFILFCGLYQFTRLPFGPKRAPSYFQEQMASVLVGLIYFICEMYLDDILVFGRTEDEFIINLRTIFIRLNKHDLKLKAPKCFFGFDELEWVGKVVSSDGLKMSRSRIQKLLDFPQPIVYKQLKSFLGFVNYFRDFIRNQSMLVKPLHRLLTDYKKHLKIRWTPESVKAFTDTKEAVRNITTLYFLNDTDPIYLCTDASDYGVGGYLYQTVDQIDYPIAFISLSLSGPQTRWATIQKEAYAIFHCCMQLESLLRDRKFRIRTDHRNLLYIKDASNPMIVRWFMALSEFDFSISHIAGSENIVADSMSRLCENNMLETPSTVAPEINISASVIENFTVTDENRSAISSHHNSKVGHSGVNTTVRRLVQSKLKWAYMRQHVKHFIRNCPLCQKLRAEKFPTHPNPFTTSTDVPMQCLNIDFIGPFPDSGYILVIICTFTRWVELYRTPDATAMSAARCLLQHFGRFGAPAQVRSDNGPHFAADIVKQFLILVGVQHCKTLPYSSQENSIVERCNKEINRHIRALTFDNNSLEFYEESLPFVQRILNSNHSVKLNMSAADLLFGQMINLDYGLFITPKEREAAEVIPLQDYMIKLLAIQDSLMKAAKEQQLCLDTIHTSSHTNQQYEFAIDSFVLVRYRKSLPPSRLHTIWRGPLQVLNYRDSQYTLRDLVTKKEKVYHISDMKPFIFDPAHTDPQDVARHDYLEFFVEKVLSHKGNLNLKTTIQFHIKWLGYDESHNSWEPYSNLRDLDILHDYLIQHNLTQLIPKKFRSATSS